jgi:hypothetical protein
MRTVSAKKLKNREEMKNGMGPSLQRLLRYADEGEDMLNRIVTGDESWVHHYQPESKRATVQWKIKIPLHLQPKSLRLRVWHQLGRLCLQCFGILREYC